MGLEQNNPIDNAIDKAGQAMVDFTEKHGPKWLGELRSKIRMLTGKDNGSELAEDYIEHDDKVDDNEAIHVASLRDPDLLTRYLASRDQEEGFEDDTLSEMLLSANVMFHQNSAIEASLDTTEQATAEDLYKQLNGLEDVSARNLTRYSNEVSDGKYGHEAPVYLAGMREDHALEAYRLNRKAYGRTFPSSHLVKGKALQTIVDEAIADTENLGFARLMNLSNLGRPGEDNILANPNLKPEQKQALCGAILKLEFRRGPKNEARLSQLMDTIADNAANLPQDSFVQLVDHYYGPDAGKGSLSGKTYYKLMAKAEELQLERGQREKIRMAIHFVPNEERRRA